MVSVAAILAGGRSKRMGTDKAFVEVDGIPLAERTARTIEQCNIGTIHLVGNNAQLARLGRSVLEDDPSEYHPLFGVATALTHHPHSLVLVVPCDIVNLEVPHLMALIESGGPCIARSNGIIHPLVGIFPGNLASRSRQIAKIGGAAARLVQDFSVCDLPGPTLVDANSPELLPR